MWRRTSLDNSALERPSPPQRPTMADFMRSGEVRPRSDAAGLGFSAACP